MEIPVYSKGGEKIDNLQLDDKKFGGPIRNKLLRDAVTMYEANKRQGTACTKTRGEVAGGGRKPWVQKHTGRARAGSIRSPLWKGGGVSHGPKPRDYSFSIPKKARKLALYTALSAKVRDNELVVIDNLNFDIPKTKQMVGILKALNIDNSGCLIVIPKANEKFFNVKVQDVRTLVRKGKARRVRFKLGRTKDWKKAVITLKEGSIIDFGY